MIKSTLTLAGLCAALMLSAGDVIFADGKLDGKAGKGVTVADNALVWTFQPKQGHLSINLADGNFAAYNALEITFDASRAGDKAVIVLVSNPEGAKDFNYYGAYQKIEKEGVQTWTIPFKSFWTARKPVGWDKISQLQIGFEGWELVTAPGLTLKVQSIKLIKQ